MLCHTLPALLENLNVRAFSGPRDATISHLTQDSRAADTGSLFFAVSGIHADGHAYVEQAVERGAAAVVHTKPLRQKHEGVAYILVDDGRLAMSRVASAFFAHPSQKLTVIGVTGTDGKSTTVSMIDQLLEGIEIPTGLLSTVEIKTSDRVSHNPFRQSTPEAIEVHRLLYEMLENGKTHVVLEATSHGLAARTARLADVAFDVAVFTNLSHEHLEFHGTLEQYRDDKANLFRSLQADCVQCFGVVNEDDANADFFRRVTQVPVFGFSLRPNVGSLWARDLELSPTRSGFRLCDGFDCVPTQLQLPGRFNIENALAAWLAVSRLQSVPLRRLAALVPSLHGIRGRQIRVEAGQPFNVVVDFGHTPGSFSKVLPAMRDHTPGRLIVVFGSAGERDRGKRPALGAVAASNADCIVLTDEDPRGEDRMAILEEIAAGVRDKVRGESLFLVADRRKAIRTAFELAEPGDTVLLLGKGHESSIEQADGPHPWDEVAEARSALADVGYTTPAR